jgi:XRE family aerobic/anaerobic benzoate catabolism transcriptional regulator
MDDSLPHLPAKPGRSDKGGLEADSYDQPDAYLAQLGQRVRSLRAIRGMSRKVLARESGVSERYIAQLESGLGNVSILLLRRVAEAIGTPVEDLVADPLHQPQDWPLLRDRLRRAAPAQRESVLALLDGGEGAKPRASEPPRDRIALIGLRGAGKSTLGRLTAQQLGWPFIELNREIERDNGLAVAEVFSLYGQDGYRRLEQAALDRVIQRPGPMILATGGGIVADPLTFERLLTSFRTIWIKARPDQHMKRVRAQGDHRPMQNERAAMAELETILASRTALYNRAARVVDTSEGNIDENVARLLSSIDPQRDV